MPHKMSVGTPAVLLAAEAQCPAVEPALSLSAQIFFVVTLSLTAVSFFVVGAMSGWCAARWCQPVSVSNISTDISCRSIAVPAQTTYKRWLSQPRFVPLPTESQGAFID